MTGAQQRSHDLRDLAAGATTIVMVPGLDGTALLFYRQIPLLAERFNVVAFPLPDSAGHDMADIVEELHQLVSEVSTERVILCGESFGGALSLSFALAHPEAVAGLVILNSFPVIRTRLRLRLAPAALRLLPWGAMPLVRRFTAHRLHSPHALPEDLAEFRERSKAIGRSELDSVAGVGPKRKRALLHRFGSARAVAQAGLADLETVDGINKTVARLVYDHFHGEP